MNRRPLRIAFFNAHTANVGSGAERLIYNTAKSLLSRGHDARIYVMNAGLDKTPPRFVHQIPVLPYERYIEQKLAKWTGWNDTFFIYPVVMKFHPWIGNADIWHFHNLHGHYISIPLLGHLSWVKRVVVSPVDQFLSTGFCPYPINCEKYLTGCGSCPKPKHEGPTISRDATRALWKIKFAFSRFSNVRLLFHTHALARHYASTYVRCRPSKVIHYGEDINAYRPMPREACASRLGVKPSDRFVVALLHSHVFDPRKGILSLVQSIIQLGKRFPGKIELLIVGHDSQKVKEIIPPELSFTALPFLQHSRDFADALNLCDVLLYPTLAENLSLTCLNALACGVPVISYDAGGQNEAVIDGKNGFIVPINDQDGVIKAVTTLLNDPDLHERMSKNARKTAVNLFNLERYTDDLIEYYYEIL